MNNQSVTSLGFSDLTDDEAFVISVFRHWHSISLNRTLAERQLSKHLQDDPLHGTLRPLFEWFKTLPTPIAAYQHKDSAVLTSLEEDLLNEVGTACGREYQTITNLQHFMRTANANIRQISQIQRSGHDHLVELIDQTAAMVQQRLCADYTRGRLESAPVSMRAEKHEMQPLQSGFRLCFAAN